MWTGMADAANKFNLHHIPTKSGEGVGDGFIYTGGNSGYQALNLALQWGAKQIILLGFTMKRLDNKNHWHPDHRHCNPTDVGLKRWAALFNRLPMFVDKSMIKVYGESAITAFERIESL